jgi:hypothetical protein
MDQLLQNTGNAGNSLRNKAQASQVVSGQLAANAQIRPSILCKPIFLDIFLDIRLEVRVGSSQKRAIQNYRSRLSKRGLARFEVLGRDADRDLIRSLAKRLTEDTPEASELRAAVSKSISGDAPKSGGILAALRRSPLVGADLDLSRPREKGRKVDL